MSRRVARLLRKTVKVGALVGVLGAGLLVGSLWLEHDTSFELPVPTGR